MKKTNWLIIVLLLCGIILFVPKEFQVCGWFDALLNQNGCIRQLKSAGMVTEMTFSPDGQTLATLSGDRSIRLWKMNDTTLLHMFVQNDNATVYKLDFTPDGATLGIVLQDTIQLWQVSDGTLSDTFKVTDMQHVVFSPDWTVIALGYSGGALELWRLNDKTLLHKLQDNQFSGLYSIQTMAFSPDGTIFASGSADGLVRLWRVSDGTLLRELKGHTRGVESIAFSPDGTILASGSVDNTVRLWRVGDGTVLRILNRPKHLWFSNQIGTIAFSPDGKVIAGGGGNSVQLWRVSDGTLLRTLSHSRAVWDVAFSSDGKIFATTQARGPVSLFDVQQMLKQ